MTIGTRGIRAKLHADVFLVFFVCLFVCFINLTYTTNFWLALVEESRRTEEQRTMFAEVIVTLTSELQ